MWKLSSSREKKKSFASGVHGILSAGVFGADHHGQNPAICD